MYTGIRSQKGEEVKAKAMLEQMYYFLYEYIEQLPAKLLKMLDEGEDKGRVVCDYISGMTDKYAITKFKRKFYAAGMESGWILMTRERRDFHAVFFQMI